MFLKITDKLAIGAEYYETSRSWGHKAHLYRVRTPEQDDLLIESEKIRYYNRTWESYQFQCVMQSVVNKALQHKLITKKEAQVCQKYLEKDHINDNSLKTIAMIASLGDIFRKDKKDANDWKERMLRAGLENRGLIMPEDWDTLTEDEKEKRLNGAIYQLKREGVKNEL